MSGLPTADRIRNHRTEPPARSKPYWPSVRPAASYQKRARRQSHDFHGDFTAQSCVAGRNPAKFRVYTISVAPFCASHRSVHVDGLANRLGALGVWIPSRETDLSRRSGAAAKAEQNVCRRMRPPCSIPI